MKPISLCWSFFEHGDAIVALLVVDPICTLNDVLDPAVFQHYERGIYERFPNAEIRFIAYVRERVAVPEERYRNLMPMLNCEVFDSEPQVNAADLIAALDDELVRSESFVIHATEDEWRLVAPPGYARPPIWTLVTSDAVQPSPDFDDACRKLTLLLVPAPEASAADIDSVAKANQLETERCFPGCLIRVAIYVPGSRRPRAARYRLAQLPTEWSSLSTLQWEKVDDVDDLLLLDSLLMRNGAFFRHGTEEERDEVDSEFRDAYWERERRMRLKE